MARSKAGSFKRNYFSADVAGLTSFNRGLKAFNRSDRVVIVRQSIRQVLKPGVREIRDAAPRARGKMHTTLLLRRARKGYPISPRHGALTARVSVRPDRWGGITGILGFRRRWAWYLQIVESGFTTPAGGHVAARVAVAPVVRKYTVAAARLLPKMIGRRAVKKLAARNKKRRLRKAA